MLWTLLVFFSYYLLKFIESVVMSSLLFLIFFISVLSLFSWSGQTLIHVSDAFKEPALISLIFTIGFLFSIHWSMFRFFFLFIYFGFNFSCFSNFLGLKLRLLSLELSFFLINIFNAITFQWITVFGAFQKFWNVVFFYHLIQNIFLLKVLLWQMRYLEVCCLIYMYLGVFQLYFCCQFLV